MSAARVYSDRLGALSDAQFQTAADRFGLGRFVKAEPTSSGLFGQNVFVTTTTGDYVLRGAPHWVTRLEETAHRPNNRWQFTSERWFAEQLHTQTRTPVPWPMLHDEASDIFGWPYLVMPKMPGHCFGERDILKHLGAGDRRGVAEAMGAMLAEMHTLKAPFAGSIDVDTLHLTPFEGGFTGHVVAELRAGMRYAEASGALADTDRLWIAAAEERALTAGARPDTYVHCDYKLNNLTVSTDGDGWRVTGLVDLHEAKFGDGALDLVRQACSYLDTEPALARVFVESYRTRIPDDPKLAALMPLYILNDRMKFWSFFTRPGARAEWTEGKTFRGWAERYSDGVLSLF